MMTTNIYIITFITGNCIEQETPNEDKSPDMTFLLMFHEKKIQSKHIRKEIKRGL